MSTVNVYSEIGKLKKVILHRPAKEFLALCPENLERLSYDDMPELEGAIEEHDVFARVLQERGVEVVYLEDLVAEAISQSEQAREEFITQYIAEAGLKSDEYRVYVRNFLEKITDNKALVLKTMEGIYSDDIKHENARLVDIIEGSARRMIVDAIVCPLFTRDPFACIGNTISLNRMYSNTRQRETIYGEYILKYHPDFIDVKASYSRYNDAHIEGGDILVLSENVLAIGVSLRTEPDAIETLAKNLFLDPSQKFDTVLAFKIPESWAFMHLDTVFTQIDIDKFTIHPEIMGPLEVYEIRKGDNGDISINAVSDELENILKKHLNLDEVHLLQCAGGDIIGAGREQFYDGTNTFCVEPGVVICYKRNRMTNKFLREAGIEVIELDTPELTRGRGGPRCMTMPLVREVIKR